MQSDIDDDFLLAEDALGLVLVYRDSRPVPAYVDGASRRGESYVHGVDVHRRAGISDGAQYQAMKQGVIEGAEPAAAGMDLYSLYEVCPYILRSNHMFSFNSVVISTELWNSLPEVYKTIISEEVQKAAADEQKAMEAAEDSYFEKFEQYGCTIDEWENYQELVDLFAPTWDETAAEIGGNAPQLLESIKACA